MGKIKWTEKAESHLHAIHDYIAQDSLFYATRFISSLIRATRKLEMFPFCGRYVPELPGYNFREVIYKNYRIVYRIIEEENIEVLAVIHSAREMQNVLREEWNIE